MPHSPTCTLFPYTTLFRSLPVAAPAHMTADIFLNHMALDKKVTNGKIRLVLLRSLGDRKSTRLNSSHVAISYADLCLKKKKRHRQPTALTHQDTGQIGRTN